MNIRSDLKNSAQRIWHALLCLMLVSAPLLGCGAADEDGGTNDGGAEIGAAELAISSKAGPSIVMGVSTAASHVACTRTNAGQVCLVPGNNVLGYCIETAGLTASQVSTVRSLANSFNGVTNGKFQFIETVLAGAGGSCGGVAGQDWDFVINNLSSGFCGGTGGDSITNYSCVNFPTAGGGAPTLIESIPGTFYNWTGGLGSGAIVHFELAEINNRGANATEDDKLLRHAVMHGLAALVGIGDETATTNLWSSHSILPLNQTRHFGSLGELCRADSWAGIADQTHLSITGAQCAADF